MQGNGFFSRRLVGGIGFSLLLHGGLGLLLIVSESVLKEEPKLKEKQFEAIEVVFLKAIALLRLRFRNLVRYNPKKYKK
ncbi:MAG: hypothetical protein HC799_00250 [Limnothrix sp. RL_2_0]|nr:hypothetical protein [Limnothrix sp. RL_2_0]